MTVGFLSIPRKALPTLDLLSSHHQTQKSGATSVMSDRHRSEARSTTGCRQPAAGLDPAGHGLVEFRTVFRNHLPQVVKFVEAAVSSAQGRVRDEGRDIVETDVGLEPQHFLSRRWVGICGHVGNPPSYQ
jgi:hypothetical protein